MVVLEDITTSITFRVVLVGVALPITIVNLEPGAAIQEVQQILGLGPSISALLGGEVPTMKAQTRITKVV